MPFDAHNPLGLDGFAFAEFTSDDPQAMAGQLQQLGFVPAARKGDLTLYRQGRIRLVLNAGGGQAQAFRKVHGPSANGMAFRVANAERAYAAAVEHGARPLDPAGTALPQAKAIEGIG